MLEPLKKRNDLAGPKVVEALKKRHFEAYYISDSKDVAAKVLELIPADHSVSWGGTMTVDALGIKRFLLTKVTRSLTVQLQRALKKVKSLCIRL